MASNQSPLFCPEILKYARKLHEETTPATVDGGATQSGQVALKPDNNHVGLDASIETFDDLLKYLSSPQSDAMAPVATDTSYPLSDYFISSSHNTYLWGNQLYGKSSAEAYRNVLHRGCRSVEIDVWDPKDDSDSDTSSSDSESEIGDGEQHSRLGRLSRKVKREVSLLKSKAKAEGTSERSEKVVTTRQQKQGVVQAPAPALHREPRVLHGYTATKEVAFRTVCQTIAQQAFEKSDLPVIVSLEVHASPPQQKIMVEIMREYWGPYLGDLDVEVTENTPLPLLESLRKRILVKVKYSAPKKGQEKKSLAVNAAVEGDSSDEEAQDEAVQQGHIIPELGNMGIYTRSYHFQSFDQPEARYPTHVFSLSEKKLLSTHKQDASALFRHNQKYLMRAYPKGMRVTSTNLDPAPFWRQGVQMVALNWQYLNAALMLNHAMFHGTGGWVLKPEGYRSEHHATSQRSAIKRGILDLSIEFLAGQKIGPANKFLKLYVSCELHTEEPDESQGSELPEGVQSKEGQIKARTEAARGYNNPDFWRQTLRFKGVPDIDEELTFVRFKVKDDETLSRDDMFGWACFRLDRLQQGIRLLHLYDPEGELTDGTLLVRIKKNVTVA
ncbi:hypothetical protein AAFC00_006239 [Neodothiora populina]|uniref:Phosphoinositide phospholipase C n=1 Tax=Neodothiora populina TaxID=2781224 RepID=A0ABR3P4X4_9PEZI